MNIPSTRRRIALVVSAAVLILSPVTLAAHARGATQARRGDLTRILSPRDGALVTVDGRGAVTVRVRTSRNVRVFQAFIGLRPVTNRFSRPRHGIRTAAFKVGNALRLGQNTLTIRSSGHNRSDFDDATFTVARRHGGLLSVSARQALFPRQLVRVVLNLSTTDYQLRASLNGRSVASRFATGVRRSAVALDVDDGLRYGRNTLVITAIHGRSYDRVTRTFTVRRIRALVGAGQPARTRATVPVKLDATRSQPAGSGDVLRYSWRIIRKPRGSKHARLRRAGTARPTFVPDVNGRFTLRVTAREVGATANSGGPLLAPPSTDTVTVLAQSNAPPIGDPIQTIKPNGGGIIYQGKVQVQGGGGVQMLVIDRSTAAVVSGATFPYTDAGLSKFESRSSGIRGVGNGDILVLTGGDQVVNPPPSNWVAALQSAYQQFGGSTRLFPGSSSRPYAGLEWGQWSLIGVRGMQPGQAAQSWAIAPPGNGSSPGSLNGYIQLDQSQNYKFQFTRYIPFDTSVPGVPANENRVTVGGASFTSQPLPAGESGFHVVVLIQGALAPMDQKTFPTNDAQGNQLTSNVSQMASYLQQVKIDTGAPFFSRPPLVIVQSIGSPRPASSAWTDSLAPAITALGGTADVFNTIPSANNRGGYTLVGGPDLSGPGAEQSTPNTPTPAWPGGQPARLRGVLTPNNQSIYTGDISEPTGGASFSMLEIAGQPSTAWPVSSTPGQQQAMRCLASHWNPALPDPNNVRSAYWIANLDNADVSTGQLQTAADQCRPGVDFNPSLCNANGSADDLVAVYCELNYEIPVVLSIDSYFKELRSDLKTAYVTGTGNFSSIGLSVELAVQPPPVNRGFSNFVNIFSNAVGSIARMLPVPVVPGAIGALASGIGLASSYADDPNGNGLSAAVQSNAAQLQGTIANKFADVINGLVVDRNLLVGDYGKLRAAGARVNREWNTTNVISQFETYWTRTIKQWFYTSLLPVAFQVWSLDTGNPNNCAFYYWPDGSWLQPFYGAPSFSWITTFNQFNGNQPVVNTKILGTPDADWVHAGTAAQMPPESVLSPMFNPNDSGWVGLFPRWAFNQGFVTEPISAALGGGHTGCRINPFGPPAATRRGTRR